MLTACHREIILAICVWKDSIILQKTKTVKLAFCFDRSFHFHSSVARCLVYDLGVIDFYDLYSCFKLYFLHCFTPFTFWFVDLILSCKHINILPSDLLTCYFHVNILTLFVFAFKVLEVHMDRFSSDAVWSPIIMW